MNVTLSIDERVLKRARRVVASMGKSLNQLIREQLEKVTSEVTPNEFMKELRQLSAWSRGNSRGGRFSREAAHERP